MKLLPQTSFAAAVLGLAGLTHAGEVAPAKAPVAPVEPVIAEESAVSGSVSFDYNSHFISYGLDVWGGGSDLDDVLFNPSLELSFALPGDASFFFGTWWDVNDQTTTSDIGRYVQEIDVWVGVSKDFGPVSASLLYQAWMYAEDTEQIVDLILGFDTVLAPSVTVHGRVAEGASGGDTGVVGVLGIDGFAVGDGVALGPVSLSLPISVAFATDGFHAGGSGYAYTSAGLSASVPLAFIGSQYGDWDFHFGATYYHTSTTVIPNNADESFVTLTAGIGVSF